MQKIETDQHYLEFCNDMMEKYNLLKSEKDELVEKNNELNDRIDHLEEYNYNLALENTRLEKVYDRIYLIKHRMDMINMQTAQNLCRFVYKVNRDRNTNRFEPYLSRNTVFDIETLKQIIRYDSNSRIKKFLRQYETLHRKMSELIDKL